MAGSVLAACTGTGGDAGQKPAASKLPVTLQFLSWRPPAMDQFAPFWADYTKQTNVTISVDKSGDFAQEKITTMFAADSGPDLWDTEF